MRLSKSKGFFLVTVLVILIFLVMFAAAITVSTNQTMLATTGARNRQRARNAALSGLEYAKMRLLTVWGDKGPDTWRGGDAGKTISTSQVTVIEHFDSMQNLGWVEGYHTGDPEAKFFIYFTRPSTTTINDPVVGTVTPRYRSINNFDSFDTPANNVTFTGELYRIVPPLAANIIVQGRCGPWEKHVESLIFVLPDGKYSNHIAISDDTVINQQNHNAQWLLASSYNLHPEIRIGGNLEITPKAGMNVTSCPVDMHNYGQALVGNNILFNNPQFTTTPEEAGFKQKLGRDQVFSEGIPAIDSSDTLIGNQSTADPEIELNAGIYKIITREKTVVDAGGKPVLDANGVPVTTKFIKVHYFPYNSEEEIPDNYLASTVIWDKDSYADENFNNLNKALNIDKWDNFVSGCTLKNKIKIKKVDSFMDPKTGTACNVNARDIKIIIDTPFIPYVNTGENYIKNDEGSIDIDAQLGGNGGLYARNNIQFWGQSETQTENSLTLYSKEGDVTLERGKRNGCDIQDVLAEYDKSSGSYESGNYMTESQIGDFLETWRQYYRDAAARTEETTKEDLYGIDTIPREKLEAYGDPECYISQAIINYWETYQQGKAPFTIKLENSLYNRIGGANVDFRRNGEKVGSGNLYTFMQEKYGLSVLGTKYHLLRLLKTNSLCFFHRIRDKNGTIVDTEYVSTFEDVHLSIFKRIAEYKPLDAELVSKLNTEQNRGLNGFVYAGGSFKAQLAKDSLTVRGAIVAGNMHITAGNFNTYYDPAKLRVLYNLGNNTIRESFRVLFDQ